MLYLSNSQVTILIITSWTRCQRVTGRFAYGSFRLPSVRLRLDSLRLRTVCQFAYVLNSVLWQSLWSKTMKQSRSQPCVNLTIAFQACVTYNYKLWSFEKQMFTVAFALSYLRCIRVKSSLPWHKTMNYGRLRENRRFLVEFTLYAYKQVMQ